ncbi:hypothetical protein V500_09670 [Pseudogymnoascus sp. VKM F-4518 (FW-2643)]|nr:hypothetical protein V500_09670 [Pseudogymnoascus sp. VKM F-4518 (FW-2643)]KFZ09148.1 hypothetical protein V502_08922 [Pseudogymnoascus sp. VKM F-4520 (FW-2644)]
MGSRSPSPASSPLSNADSDSYEAEYYQRHIAASHPSKRQRLDEGSLRATSASHDPEFDTLSSISSDTSGDVPQSPSVLAKVDDEDAQQDQVTVCAWEGCDGGDFGDMDKLVAHIHNVHTENKGKKNTCEWAHCPRKSHAHASAYALRAHMRSHTREKPFFCALPECDRSFTRSDALAKHMRIVHETEALRPSDPTPRSILPKSMQPQGSKSSNRLKIIIKNQGGRGSDGGQSPAPRRGHDGLTPLTADDGFTLDELALGTKELWRLLRRQAHWADEEAESLKQEIETMNEIRDKEWLEKEILLDQVIKNEMDWFERRKHVLATLPTVEELRSQTMAKMERAGSGSGSGSGSRGGREEREAEQKVDQREAAAALASLAQQS